MACSSLLVADDGAIALKRAHGENLVNHALDVITMQGAGVQEQPRLSLARLPQYTLAHSNGNQGCATTTVVRSRLWSRELAL